MEKGLESSKKYNKRVLKVKREELNFAKQIWLTGQKTCVIFYKTYDQISLALFEKEMDQFIILFFTLVGEERHL